MKIVFHKHFEKQFLKLRPAEKKRFKERKDIFMHDPYHPVLNNHPLRGTYKGYRSINVGGDLRAVYTLVNDDAAFFVAIDRHSNLYS
ncbi:MAG: type II toxin-antitoxin system mRNA interferase toxin, RelE/StbE family [Candidatus Komeilibacteria bacterium]|nr:type II toxin-antitoxin system mRNA interferase toxin, RelE/StbE family [Candidatus Komeilibacteria bacterium]